MPKFVVKKDAKGHFRFNLVANNGEIIATSESYKAKPKAMKTIESIQKGAAGAKVVDMTEPTKTAAKAPAKKLAAKKPAVKSAPAKKAAPAKKKPTAKKAAVKKAAPAPAAPAPAPAPAPTATPTPTANPTT